MNLAKLFDMQRELDQRIIKDKGLEGQELIPNTFLALQVELSEFANEGRWFKHWSNDRKPRTEVKQHVSIPGYKAKGVEIRNPLLEEFVDSLHFYLSIAIQKGWQEALYIYEEQLDPVEFTADLTSNYLEMTYFLNKAYMENYSEEENKEFESKSGFPKKQYWFRIAWILFLNIGVNGFGFTLEQIEAAYLAKNKVNHQRQEEGY